jgi:hypothetical protein
MSYMVGAEGLNLQHKCCTTLALERGLSQGVEDQAFARMTRIGQALAQVVVNYCVWGTPDISQMAWNL